MIVCSDEYKVLTKCWELEEVSPSSQWNNDDRSCKDYYTATTNKNPDSTYTVRIPFKEMPEDLRISKPKAAPDYSVW